MVRERHITKMKFKLLESTYYADKDYLIEKNKKTKHQRRIERAKKGSAIVNSKVHNPLTCPQCMAQLKGEVNDKQPAQNESFEYNLEPGNDYYFMHNSHLTKGKFKYKTKAWQVFEREDGEEVRINAWSNVATTPEDITGVEQVVDRMEKDTKVPNVLHLPNRFVK